jgi:hypothetical protein
MLSTETSVTINKPTRPNTLEGLKNQQHRYDNLKTHTIQDSLNVIQGKLPMTDTQGTVFVSRPLAYWYLKY